MQTHFILSQLMLWYSFQFSPRDVGLFSSFMTELLYCYSYSFGWLACLSIFVYTIFFVQVLSYNAFYVFYIS